MKPETRTLAHYVATQLMVNGYLALPCATCGRADGVIGVHDLYQLLMDLVEHVATEIERYTVQPDEAGGEWHVLTYGDGKQTQIYTDRPLVMMEPEAHCGS